MEVEIWKQLLTCAVVVAVFFCFLKEWLSPDLAAMGAFVLLVLVGVIGPDSGMTVFANGAPITVACMFVMSAALERTGLIEALGSLFERVAGKSPFRVLAVLLLIVATLSSVANNTPVVVVFLPIVLRHCRKFDLKASHYLIPLSYAAIVGGTCTMIGTSTNLIAGGMAEEVGLEPFSMFEVGKLGIVFVAVTIVYLLLFGRKLLPNRITLSTLFEAEEGKEFLTQAIVSEASPLVGKPFPESPLAKMRELRIIEVVRNGETLKTPLNLVTFERGDLLLLKSRAAGVMELSQTRGLDLLPESDLGLSPVSTQSAVIMEGIVGPGSSLEGRSLRDLNFRQRYGVLILAVHRQGENLRERFEEVKLNFGDTLLVEGPADRMNELFEEKDFINLSRPKDRPLRRSKAPVALAALAAFMVFGSFQFIPVQYLALAAVFVVMATRCIDPAEAYEAVQWRVIFMIFGMLGLGLALKETGTARLMAEKSTEWFGVHGAPVMLCMVYLLTAILTELISNNAVAALVTPIAIGVAQSLNVDPRPFVVAVMFAASASFVTPIGYQTNTYVFGAGGYRFSDFSKVGLPLAVLLWLVASLLIPKIWAF